MRKKKKEKRSLRSQVSKKTETDSNEDLFEEHPTEPEQWDVYNEVWERRTKERQEAIPSTPRPPAAPRQREDADIEHVRRERMQEQEERRNLAQRHQQRILAELGKRKVHEESSQPMPMKRQREEIMEQGHTSQAEPMPSLARDGKEEFPL